MKIDSIARIRLLYVRAWHVFYSRYKITYQKKCKNSRWWVVRGKSALENSGGMWCNVIGEWFLTFRKKSLLDSWEKAPRSLEILGTTCSDTK
jgi:hypothetical protein